MVLLSRSRKVWNHIWRKLWLRYDWRAHPATFESTVRNFSARHIRDTRNPKVESTWIDHLWRISKKHETANILVVGVVRRPINFAKYLSIECIVFYSTIVKILYVMNSSAEIAIGIVFQDQFWDRILWVFWCLSDGSSTKKHGPLYAQTQLYFRINYLSLACLGDSIVFILKIFWLPRRWNHRFTELKLLFRFSKTLSIRRMLHNNNILGIIAFPSCSCSWRTIWLRKKKKVLEHLKLVCVFHSLSFSIAPNNVNHILKNKSSILLQILVYI